MKFEATELLLANTVREIAKQMRSEALRKATDSEFGKWRAGKEMDTDEERNSKMDFQDEWKRNNPLAKFIVDAMKELEAVAEIIANRS